MPSSPPGSSPTPLYYVVGRSAGDSRLDTYSALLFEGPDRSEAEDAYQQGVAVAKLARAATVTLYRQGDGGRLRAVERFDGAAWRMQQASLALARAVGALQAVGAAVGGAL